MKTSDFLREVKALRARDRYYRRTGLCIGCWDLVCRDQKYPEAAKRATGYIQQLLEGNKYLQYWLVYRGYATWKQLSTWAGQQKLARTRDAWLDWLIADFESRGD